MSIQNPVYVIQTGSHGAQLFREAISSLMSSAGGVVDQGDYQVTAQGTPNMTVNVAGGIPGGRAWVPGTSSSGIQGNYFVYNSGTVVQTLAASNPSNPRIDISVLQIVDSFYVGGSTNTGQLAIVTGTPAGSPVQPTTPASSLLLAALHVSANATTVTTGNITDKRVYMQPANQFVPNFGALNPLLGTLPATGVGGFKLQGGSAQATPFSGAIAVTFPEPFANGVLTAWAINGDDSTNVGAFCSMNQTTAPPTLTGCVFVLRISSTGAAANNAARINWGAIGW